MAWFEKHTSSPTLAQKPTNPMPKVENWPTLKPVPVDILPTKQFLAKEAREKLGYRALDWKISRDLSRQAVLTALAELDIAPFDTEAVEQYKNKMEKWFDDPQNGQRQTGSADFFSWRKHELKEYTEAIPESVLQMAIRIKDKLPETQFGVDVLERQHRTADPFLFFVVNNERYYVAVWDEPTFDVVGAQLAYKPKN